MTKSQHAVQRLIGAGLWLVLAGYAAVLIKIILLKYGLGANLRALNLVPFRFVGDLLHPTTSFGVVLKNVLGNFAIFIPLGILAPALCGRVDTLWKGALVGLAVSALFETLQGAFGLGATDIDDLLLNTLGALAGGALYFLGFKRLGSPCRTRGAALAFLCVFGLLGVLSLWLYAPSELPRSVAYENVAALDGLDTDTYTVSRTLERIDAQTVVCRAEPTQAGEQSEAAALPPAYPLSPDAKLYIAELSYRFSPNGNIQKTTCTYSAATIEQLAALIEKQGAAFADLWLDETGACAALIATAFSD